MKKIITSRIFIFILGAVMFSGITAVAAQQIYANQISYSHATWKKANGENITNVEEAIDELYNKSNKEINLDLLWTNPNPSADFSAQTINTDLTNYKYIVIVTKAAPSDDESDITYNLISTANSNDIISANSSHVRVVDITNTSIQISLTNYGSDSNHYNHRVIPLYIYGLKEKLNFE